MQQGIFMLLLSLIAITTSSCGFRPNDNTYISQERRTLIFNQQDFHEPLTRSIYKQLRLNGITLVKDKKLKNIPSLHIVTTSKRQHTISIFQNGKTAEHQMVLKVHAQILIPGHEMYPVSVSVFRSFFDNPINVLAQDSEKEIISNEMHDQAAQQLIHKLLTIPLAPATIH